MSENTSSLLQEGDKDEEIKVLKEAMRLMNVEMNRLLVKADKWDALGDKIARYYPDGEEDSGFDDSEGLIGIGEAAAHAFGYL